MKIEVLMHEFCAYAHYFRGVSYTTIKNYKNIISFFARSAEIEDIHINITEKKVQSFLLIV
ncbi:hypothetical protein D5R40_32580 [Okeania hirsuta]|uniref:Uncharacterized protein n=1 Tax=Okeania hirsuta TaxID=1458930 RepID=A0A3N6R0P0_9CYAN|nr:hypothetical protein D5R40_32580 [Okeania hirsuta]